MKAAIAASVAIRLLVIAIAWWRRGETAFLVPDSRGYMRLAGRLLEHGAFLDRNLRPELFRTPGYPLLLVPGTWLGWPIVSALAINLLLTAAIVALTYWIARELLVDERKARLCALIVAIEPTMLTWSLKVMPETLFTLCLLAFVWACVSGRAIWTAVAKLPLSYMSKRAAATAAAVQIALPISIAAAFALSAAAYVRPIAYPLVIVLALAALLAGVVRRAPSAVAFALLCVLFLAPWHIRNWYRAQYAGFSTVTERALFLSAGGSVAARQANRPYEDVRQEMLEEGAVRGTPDPAKHARMRREGLARLASDPLGYAKTHIAGMLRTLFDPGAAEYLRIFGLYDQGARDDPRRYPLVLGASILLGILLLPLVVLPLAAIFRRPPRLFWLLAIVVAYLVIAGGGVPGNYRFRAPAVPLLVVMSAFAFRERPATLPR